VEPFLWSPSGAQALEIENYTFAGRAAHINLISGTKDTPDRKYAWYELTERRIQIDMRYPAADIKVASDIFRSAVELAEFVSADFSSFRVDLYLIGGGLIISELTPYTNGGVEETGHFGPQPSFGPSTAGGNVPGFQRVQKTPIIRRIGGCRRISVKLTSEHRSSVM